MGDNIAVGSLAIVMIFLSIMVMAQSAMPRYDMRCYHDVNEPHKLVEMRLDQRFGKVLVLQTTNGVCIPVGVSPSDGR